MFSEVGIRQGFQWYWMKTTKRSLKVKSGKGDFKRERVLWGGGSRFLEGRSFHVRVTANKKHCGETHQD